MTRIEHVNLKVTWTVGSQCT